MFNSRIFWKIYLKFILLIVLTGLVVGILAAYQIIGGIAAICIGALLALLCGLFLARQIAAPLELLSAPAHLNSDGGKNKSGVAALGKIEYRGEQPVLSINRDITDRKQAENDLRESEQHLLSVTNSAQDAIVSADNRGNIIFWNEGARIIFGYEEREVIGKPLSILMPEKYRDAHAKGMQRHIETGEKRVIGQVVELHGFRKDGAEFPLELSLGEWETGKGKYFTGIMRDITERRAAENTVKESEQSYRFLSEGIKHQVWTSLPDGKLDYVNKRTLDYFGFSMEQAINDGWKNVVHPEDLFLCAERWTDSLKTGADYEVEFRLKRADGEYRWHSGLATAGRDADGKIIKWFGTNTDIDDKKSVEKIKRESDEKFRSFIETTKDWIWEIDANGNSIYNNPAVETILGYTPEELEGKRFMSYMVEEDRAESERIFSQCTNEKRGWTNLVCRWRHKDGGISYLESSSVPVLDDGSEVIGFRGTNHDITERRQTENTLRRSQSALDATQDGVFMFNPETLKFFYVNHGATRQVGYSQDELLQMSPLDIKPEFTEAMFRQTIAPMIDGKQNSFFFNTVHRRKDGADIPVEIILQYVASAEGENLFVAMVRDITERRQAEEALRRSEANLAAAQHIAHLGSWEVELSETSRIKESKVRWSDEVYRIFGYEPGKFEVSFDHFFDAVHPLDRKQVRRAFLEAVSRRKDLDVSYRIVLPNGDERFQCGQGKVIYDEQLNKPVRFIGTVQDITERKLAEMELSKLAAIVEFSNDAIFSKNLDGIITSWNKGAEQLFGYRADEIIGRHISTLFPPECLNEEEEIIENIKKGESIKNFETVRVNKNGTQIPVTLTISPIKNDKGEVVGISKVAHDITERKRAEEKLRDSQQWLKAILDGSRDGILIEDDSRITYINKAYARLLGYKIPEDLIGKNISDTLPPDEAERLSEFGRRRMRGEKVSSIYEFKGKCKKGTLVEVEGAVSTSIIGGKKYIMTAIRDITERKRIREELEKNISLLTSTFEATADGILAVSSDNKIVAFNEKFAQMWGMTAEELNELDSADAPAQISNQIDKNKEYYERTKRIDLRKNENSFDVLELKDGRIFERYSQPQKLTDKIVGRVFSFRDITKRKRAEEQLQFDAFHDGLTGIANRALFMDHLQRTIERGKSRYSNAYAVLFLDFDRFKFINDSLGHSQGDNFLKLAARRLEHSTRTGDLVARFGGDEFVVLLSEMLETDDAIRVAERIQEDLRKPFDLGGREIFASASIGIAYSAAGHAKAEDMLRDADIAMYDAKAKGRANYQIFDKEMHSRATRRLEIETEMRQALEREEFCAYYQPIVDIESGNLMGFESLIRWRHPERGMIPPFEFIPVAEENNLILPIGNWILRESCRQLREWQDAYPAATDLTVSVNLSSKEFSQKNLAEQIAETLQSTKLDPHYLKLEITESHLMENSETAVKILDRLRSLGVQISLDDFGTGYSSLSYLHRLPVNFLKIDRSFVMRMAESQENEEIVHTIIKLAKNLKMKVIAEGIETAEQLARLKQMKCEYGQGYFFSKPLETEQARLFIEKSAKDFSVPKEQPIIHLNNLDINM